jgi:hypothetical protein
MEINKLNDLYFNKIMKHIKNVTKEIKLYKQLNLTKKQQRGGSAGRIDYNTLMTESHNLHTMELMNALATAQLPLATCDYYDTVVHQYQIYFNELSNILGREIIQYVDQLENILIQMNTVCNSHDPDNNFTNYYLFTDN